MNRQSVGGKAAALKALETLPIPPWGVLGPELRDEELESALEELLCSMGDWQGLWAVRSSAVDEDGSQTSFAGQLESYLKVPREQLLQRVRDVRASALSERVQLYRREHGLEGSQVPAVLIQHMLQPRVAGVAFAVDPVEGRWDRILLSAVPGLGDALVDGSMDAVTWRLDSENQVCSVEVPDGLSADLLSPQELGELAGLVRDCSRKMGRPQDIEWAIDEKQLWLLQSRPVTTMGRVNDPEGQLAIWDNSNIAESYGGVTTALTFSFARSVYAEVYRVFCRLMGVSRKEISEKSAMFEGLLGLQDGRMYYNLLNWYRLLACFPGFSVNREFMEGMMGLSEGLPEEFRAEFAPEQGWKRGLAMLRSSGTCLGLLWNQCRLPAQVSRFQQRLEEGLRPPAKPWAEMSPDELVAEYRRMERDFVQGWDAPLVNDFFAMIWFGVLQKLCASWCGDEDGSLQNRILATQGGILSAEPARRIRDMASLLDDRPEWQALLRDASPQELEQRLPAFPELQQQVEAYLERFADRCLEELKLESETLRDNPLPLYRSIAALQQLPERKEQVKEPLPLPEKGWQKPLFAWVARQTKARVRDRENLRFERTRVFGRVRRLFLELGQRLSSAGHLLEARDVFHLTLEELLGFVEGSFPGTALTELVAARKAEGESYRKLPPPPGRFLTRGWVKGALREELTSAELNLPEGSDQERKGQGCSPGRIEGRVRVVRDPRGVELEPGTVLVAERTDPGWILLFPAASALIVERGSLLSHSAIVSRELGLPCVVGVQGATSWLQDGDLVMMDGQSGKVIKQSIDRADETGIA